MYANDEDGMAWLVARLDNLGKGASGAAVSHSSSSRSAWTRLRL